MKPLIPYNYKFFCKFFILNLLFLALARGLFLFKFSHELANLPWQELLQAFLIGAQMDSSLLAYLFAPFFVIGIMPFLLVSRLPFGNLFFARATTNPYRH